MMEFIQNLSISLPGFILAIVFHEWAHGFVALKFGDNTAEMQGRLTFNPAAHYDLVGTIIFPLIGAMLGGVMFGWAKPVPVDPRRFHNMRWGIFWVSFAGPLANIILAIFSAIFFAILITRIPNTTFFYTELALMAKQSILINIVLAVFNLIPFPPLDGSKMVSTFLDYEAARKYEELGRYSFVFIMVLWFTNIFSYLLTPAIMFSNSMMNTLIHLLG
jgi:Zn-dependent protease